MVCSPGLKCRPEQETFYQPETSLIRAVDNGREIFSQVAGGPVHPESMTTARDQRAMELVDEIRAKFSSTEQSGGLSCVASTRARWSIRCSWSRNPASAGSIEPPEFCSC